jgi:AraC family transcriptional regulator
MEYFTKGKYLGSTTNEIDFEGNFMAVTCYPDCPRSDWHYHENSFFTFVLNGTCLENRKDNSLIWKPGDLLFYKKGVIHKNCYHQENSRNFNLELNDKWLKQYDVGLCNDLGRNVLEPAEIKFLFIQLYREFQNQDAASQVSLNSILLNILGHKSHEITNNKMPPWVSLIREFLHDNWSTNFSLKQMSVILNVHPITISKNFPRYFGCTFGEYIRKIRIEKALCLIRTTSSTLTDIALTCGFADQSHFIRCFKKFTGTVPLQYRKM